MQSAEVKIQITDLTSLSTSVASFVNLLANTVLSYKTHKWCTVFIVLY